MTVADMIRVAVTRQDGVAAVRAADRLRAAGADYQTILSIARKVMAPEGVVIEAAEWDALLYEGETNYPPALPRRHESGN